MSQREQLMAAGLGAVIFFTVVGFGGYVGFYLPIQTRNNNAAAIEKEVSEKQDKLAALKRELPRLAAAQKRSLPADTEVARQEYEAALGRLLVESKVPKGYTLRPKSLDSRTIPEILPKKPAYTRLGVEITLKRVDLATLTDFLERYYRLNLLHQITRLQIKRAEETTPGEKRSGSADRPDLDVTLVSEAIILDGAETRRSLLPVPVSAGAILGGAGYQHLIQTPEIARGLTPLEVVPVLAMQDREYFAMLGKDVFHGPIPPPKPKPKPKEEPKKVEPKEEPEPTPEPPKPDIASHIKLTGITRRSDLTATVDIKDIANNLDYQVDFSMKDGKPVASVKKFFFIRGKRKTFDNGAELEISDETSSTKRKFRVVGLDEDGMVVAMRPELAKPEPPKRGFGRRPADPPPSPVTAIVGAVGYADVAPPPEKIYVWRVGQALDTLKALTSQEAQATVKRAEAGFGPALTEISADVTPPRRKVAEPAQAVED